MYTFGTSYRLNLVELPTDRTNQENSERPSRGCLHYVSGTAHTDTENTAVSGISDMKTFTLLLMTRAHTESSTPRLDGNSDFVFTHLEWGFRLSIYF